MVRKRIISIQLHKVISKQTHTEQNPLLAASMTYHLKYTQTYPASIKINKMVAGSSFICIWNDGHRLMSPSWVMDYKCI